MKNGEVFENTLFSFLRDELNDFEKTFVKIDCYSCCIRTKKTAVMPSYLNKCFLFL